VAAVIRLRLRAKAFDAVPVLGAIDITLARGEVLALLGPSGAGKTTLLRILAGLEEDFDGEVLRGDSTIRMGYLFQEARLMPWLTAEQNVALVVGGDRRRACDALEAVGLGDTVGRFPHQLSGGMQRRVALARALVVEPDLLLLDEAFVSLDEPTALELKRRLLVYCERAAPALVLVSHDLGEALALADRICFLGGSPARIVHSLDVSLAHPRPDGALRELRKGLFEDYPQILSGLLGP
jgi:NitT/TauT family transport system ATP-binding protein